ncbi:MAG: anti-sigma factor family protein [Terriglobales bacterium]
MQCTEYREQLFDVVTGEATPDVTAHFASCRDCAMELESMRKTMALLDEWQAPEDTSPYFMTRVMARVREESANSAPASGWLNWFRRPAFALSMAAVLVAGIALFRTGDVNPPPTKADVHSCAVTDLQFLEKNEDVLQNLEVLDDIQDGSPSATANP